MSTHYPTTYIGARMKRLEDPRFIEGRATFIDDIQLPGMLHAVVVRSPHAHAKITSIDTASAEASPGCHGSDNLPTPRLHHGSRPRAIHSPQSRRGTPAPSPAGHGQGPLRWRGCSPDSRRDTGHRRRCSGNGAGPILPPSRGGGPPRCPQKRDPSYTPN